ncbi:MAG: class I SAM-dependent methyltransferase [Gammaproteobacteria bacterium]|nr:class I SAM-dependent methyltransferase [Gammaproteobacteria bacterium]
MNPWSIFWRQGHSTTFGDYFKQGYEGAVADWWQSRADKLAVDAAVLEVGCGNCSLLPALNRSGFSGRYIGLDLASVEISAVAKEGLAESEIEVILHPETPAENIPEADASIDVVASVFGIEYSDLTKSLPEVLRVLKTGGRLTALLHHAGSVVTAMSRRAMSEYDADDLAAVIDCLTVISTARDKTPSLADMKANPEAEKARTSINAFAEKYLRDTNLETANATMFEFMSNALKFFKMMGSSSEERRTFISSLADEHRASHERFRQMVAVAFDDDSIERLKVKLGQLGFSATSANVIHTNNQILAWELCTEK